MNIKTLNYIHQLLVENKSRYASAKSIAWKACVEAEKEGADNVLTLKAIHEMAAENYLEACTALNEFEAQEW